MPACIHVKIKGNNACTCIIAICNRYCIGITPVGVHVTLCLHTHTNYPKNLAQLRLQMYLVNRIPTISISCISITPCLINHTYFVHAVHVITLHYST